MLPLQTTGLLYPEWDRSFENKIIPTEQFWVAWPGEACGVVVVGRLLGRLGRSCLVLRRSGCLLGLLTLEL